MISLIVESTETKITIQKPIAVSSTHISCIFVTLPMKPLLFILNINRFKQTQ